MRLIWYIHTIIYDIPKIRDYKTTRVLSAFITYIKFKITQIWPCMH